MNLKSVYIPFITGICLFFMVHPALGQGTAFSYQGQLVSSNTPANGIYNFEFTLYSAAQTNGTVASDTLTNYDVGVTNGLFVTTLNFGSAPFNGQSLWLLIGVCPSGTTNFTVLSPLQPVLPTPYAIFAGAAYNLTGDLDATQVTGTLPATALAGYTGTVAFTNGEDLFAGAFSGNGAGVTNVSVTNLIGVLADSQLPANTAFLNTNQTFATGYTNTFNGVNIFTNLYGNSFSGSFFGNGLVGWIVVPGTATNAAIDTGYLLTNSQIVTVTLPATAHAGDVVRIACSGASGWQVSQVAGESIIGNFLSFGQTWYLRDSSDLDWTSIAISSDGTRMAAAGYGNSANDIYLSINSGQTWTASGVDTTAGQVDWTGVASSSDGTKLAAVANDNSIYISTNSGSTWAAYQSIGSYIASGIASSASGNNLVAATYGSYIYVSANGGTVWFKAENTGGTQITADWTAVASSAAGNQMYAAYIGGIYTSSNSGTNWSATGAPALDWASIACSSDGSKLIAAATNSSGGGIYVSSNSGANWTQVTSLPTPPSSGAWTSVACTSDGSEMIAAMNGGAIYTSSNWGSTWQTNATTAAWSCVAASSAGTTLAAGINNTLTSGYYGIYTGGAVTQTSTTAGTSGHISGGQGSAVELQCVGNNQWMPVSVSGTIWAQ